MVGRSGEAIAITMAFRRCTCRLGPSFPFLFQQAAATANSSFNSMSMNGYISHSTHTHALRRLFHRPSALFAAAPLNVYSVHQDAKLTNRNAKLITHNLRNMSSSSSRTSSKDRSKVHISNTHKTHCQQKKSERKVAFFIRSLQEKMKIEETPTAALGLGLAGAIPFVLLTPPFCSVLPEILSTRPLEAQSAYGAVILSFLGGPHWGLAMVRTHASSYDKVFNVDISTFRFMWSVVPSLLAWSALLLSDIPKMTLLIFSFALVLAVDVWCVMQGLLPSWFLPLRLLLSMVVTLCLISSSLHAYFKNKTKFSKELIES